MSSKLYGSFCGIMTGVCWAVSGVWGQFLFESRGVDSKWLVPVRILTAGIILLIYTTLQNRKEVWGILKEKKDMMQVILTGVCGTMMFQLAFFMTVQKSNAGTATVLQYLCPVITMIYVCLREQKKPEKVETLSVFLAMVGIFLISTHGNINSLVITSSALLWGLGTAFFMFLSTILPEDLYKKYSSMTVLSWGFIAGGIVQCIIFRPWQYKIEWDIMVLIALFFIIGGGSVFAYVFYGNAIKRIGPAKASLFSCSEPIAAALLSAIWLGTEFVLLDLIGFACILSTIFLLTKPEKQ